jgi:DNA-binding CsgD family transcriptional regulator
LPPEQHDEPETLLKLIRLGWGRDNPASRQFFTSQFMPDGTREQHQWFNDLERMSASPENAVAIVETLYQLDVTEEARRLTVPTVVMHVRNDARVPFEESRRLAGLIPGARFVPLDGRNHVLLKGEPAWAQFFDALRAFLTEDRDASGGLRGRGLTDSELEVLGLIARGLDNGGIAQSLRKSEKTVRNQVSSIFAKLDVKTRAQAIVLARESGIGGA